MSYFIKKNAFLATDDSIVVLIYDREETIDLFGEDTLEEFGVILPEELIKKYKENLKEFDEIQAKLRFFKNGPPEPERDGNGRIIRPSKLIAFFDWAIFCYFGK